TFHIDPPCAVEPPSRVYRTSSAPCGDGGAGGSRIRTELICVTNAALVPTSTTIVESTAGIEPAIEGVADPRLPTWLRRRWCARSDSNRPCPDEESGAIPRLLR